MRCEVKMAEGQAVVALAGDVDLSTSPRARRAILDCLADGCSVCVDLSAVSYLDSSAVATLVEGYQAARRGRLGFGLVGVSAAALSVLELARLDRVFPIYATVEECRSSAP